MEGQGQPGESYKPNTRHAHKKGGPLTQEQRARKQQRFLRAYRDVGIIKAACKAAGIDRSTYYDWRDHDEDFKKHLPDARDEANETLEYAAYAQAVLGVESPVVSMGRLVYEEIPAKNEDGSPKLDKHGEQAYIRGKLVTERKYAPSLLITLLKANMPEKYKERLEHTGKDGGPIQTEGLLIDTRDLTTEELALLKSYALAKKEREV